MLDQSNTDKTKEYLELMATYGADIKDRMDIINTAQIEIDEIHITMKEVVREYFFFE